MRKTFLTVVASLLLFPVLGMTQGTLVSVTVDVPFEFHIGKAVMPAGSYSFKPGSATGVIQVVRESNGNSVNATVLTRIAAWPDHATHVIFDKAGDQYYLAELHITGVDGYHFQGAPGPHTHVELKGK